MFAATASAKVPRPTANETYFAVVVANFTPVINIPGLGSFDIAANLNQAANEVVAKNTSTRLPFLQRAGDEYYRQIATKAE